MMNAVLTPSYKCKATITASLAADLIAHHRPPSQRGDFSSGATASASRAYVYGNVLFVTKRRHGRPSQSSGSPLVQLAAAT
jgi:hypothetical protein